MLIGLWFGDVGEVEDDPRVQHRFGEGLLLTRVHAIQVDRHQQRANLIVRNLSARYATYEEFDLFIGEMFTIALFANNVLWSHQFILECADLSALSYHQLQTKPYQSGDRSPHSKFRTGPAEQPLAQRQPRPGRSRRGLHLSLL